MGQKALRETSWLMWLAAGPGAGLGIGGTGEKSYPASSFPVDLRRLPLLTVQSVYVS